ncbi:MAG TPA: SLBB domain-containing protein, partial [Candidatus Kapabacteria bacterium]|nr:SLBB domain-containing protein [Candidatus Kapabacteria bacterium]
MIKKSILTVSLLFIGAAVCAQTLPEASGISGSKTFDNMFSGESAGKEMQQLEIPKGTESLFSDSYIDPKTYYLGPYDILLFNIWQPINQMTTLTVSPEGSLVIPRVGSFDVKNKTLDSTRNEIIAALRKHIGNSVQASLTLYKPRNVVVYVIGAVKQPGSYILAANTRVSLAIQMANTLSKESATLQNPMEREKEFIKKRRDQERQSLFGSQSDVDYSLRDIIIHHDDGTVNIADILKYEATHIDTLNPTLREGDQIYVTPKLADEQTISIYGAVNHPGMFEFVRGDSLTTLVAMAFGPAQDADMSNVLLQHYDATGRMVRSDKIDLQAILNNKQPDMPLQAGDGVIVGRHVERNYFGAAAVSGEVEHPGMYGIAPGKTKLSDVMRRAGGFTPEALISGGYILRRMTNVGNKDIDLDAQTEQMYAASPLQLEDTLNFNLESRMRNGAVVTDFQKLFVQGDSSEDVTLQSGDEIIVPKDRNQVYVYGHVHDPGYVQYVTGKSADYYVSKAGGEEEGAASGMINVVSGRTLTWSDPDKVDIHSGDYIYVPKKSDIPAAVQEQGTSNLFQAALVVATFASIFVNY